MRTTALSILAVVSIAGSLSAESWTDPGNYSTDWYTFNTSATNFTISSSADLGGLAVLVNGGNPLRGKTIKLSADIDLVGKQWTPIGCWNSEQYNFSGIFDGGGKTIARLTLNNTDGDYQGLFGLVMDGIIQDVNLVETSIGAGSYCGSVAGRVWSSTVRNCTNGGSLSASGTCGGVVGYAYGSEVEKCANNGSVRSSGNYAGGIVGMGKAVNCMNSGSVSADGPAGGVVGRGGAMNCTNSGEVSATNYTYSSIIGAGGVAGDVSDVGSVIENCSNSGNVSISGSGSYSYAGGVAGYVRGNGLINCMNSGNINGKGSPDSGTGGVAGWLDEYGAAMNCTSSGSVNIPGSNSHVGGVAGLVTYAPPRKVVESCFWKKDGTAGFNWDVVGSYAVMATNSFSFGGTPGTVSIGGVATPLLTVLNSWVEAQFQTTPSLLIWTLNGSQTGYPILRFSPNIITYLQTQGAINPNPTNYTSDDLPLILSPLANLPGYIFTGWDIQELPLGTTGDKTITAQWTPVAGNIGAVNVETTEITVVVNSVQLGKTYLLQKNTSLVGEWLPLDTQTASGSTLSFRVPRLENQAFFRVKLQE